MVYEGMIAETITIRGHNSDAIEAYSARPLGAGPYPGVVVIHHAPGWDEWTKEVCRKFAHHGYAAIAPHLYCRLGPGAPDDLAAKARAAGGVPDDQVMGDVQVAMDFLRAQPYANGKVGVIGFCSGGRHTYLAACRLSGIDAAVDCWGGGVVVTDPSQLTPQRPVAPVDLTEQMTAPLLGIFGNEDQRPDVAEVNATEERLKRLGKTYEFYRYDGAGHGFFNTYGVGYRQEQAVDGWKKVFAFYEKYLRAPAPVAAGVAS
ncbi:MAG: dienelactone hydrolase family protein [Dehalococcoidia bacterium]|nr:dienelactone hydrolase family protein [Dehalococcoidia bacterium]